MFNGSSVAQGVVTFVAATCVAEAVKEIAVACKAPTPWENVMVKTSIALAIIMIFVLVVNAFPYTEFTISDSPPADAAHPSKESESLTVIRNPKPTIVNPLFYT